MAAARLEHANITVSDPDRSAALLARLCGWHERWRGPAGSGFTIHCGSDDQYIALFGMGDAPGRFAKGQPLNHLALLVDDLGAAEAAVRAAGLSPFGHGDYEPGRRFYFFDWDGIEFEIVSYRPM
ncbi:VOC family protein [Parablastomonas sp. CN1-191]|uniref:VOC family protein n=1 Tax=Parablastomonas sp. CN1-191 TaxID=3400908 RepID=UPI003BF83794